MIVSHRYKFIFLKTRKTAGTSLELALSRHCGPEDVVTRVMAAGEIRRTELGGVGPQNETVPIGRRRPRDHLRALRGADIRFYNHVPASIARSWIGRPAWDDYYRFTVERNPWDKALSLYWWRTRKADQRPELSAFLRQVRETVLSNYHIYSIGDRAAVDHVMRYENLDRELESLRERLGLPEVPALPRAKGGFRKDRRPYQQVLSEEDRERVAHVCRREIAYLGYEFNEEGSDG